MRQLRKWAIYLAIGLMTVLFISVIISAGYLNAQEAVKKQNQAVTNQILDINEDGKVSLSKNYNFTYTAGNSCDFFVQKSSRSDKCPDLIYVRANITGIDIQSSKLKMHLQFYPSGRAFNSVYPFKSGRQVCK